MNLPPFWSRHRPGKLAICLGVPEILRLDETFRFGYQVSKHFFQKYLSIEPYMSLPTWEQML